MPVFTFDIEPHSNRSSSRWSRITRGREIRSKMDYEGNWISCKRVKRVLLFLKLLCKRTWTYVIHYRLDHVTSVIRHASFYLLWHHLKVLYPGTPNVRSLKSRPSNSFSNWILLFRVKEQQCSALCSVCLGGVLKRRHLPKKPLTIYSTVGRVFHENFKDRLCNVCTIH